MSRRLDILIPPLALPRLLPVVGAVWSSRSFIVHFHDGTAHVHHVPVQGRSLAIPNHSRSAEQEVPVATAQGSVHEVEGIFGGQSSGEHGSDSSGRVLERLFDLHVFNLRLADLVYTADWTLTPAADDSALMSLAMRGPPEGRQPLEVAASRHGGGSIAREMIATLQSFLI